MHAKPDLRVFLNWRIAGSGSVIPAVIRSEKMLDLDHPDTPHTFAIAREDDAVLSIVKRMTLVSTNAKDALLDRAHEHLNAMRKIVNDHWNANPEKLDAIDTLEADVTRLARLESANDYVDNWKGKVCTVCNDKITHLKGYSDMVYCPTCIRQVDDGRGAVDQAFGLWCI